MEKADTPLPQVQANIAKACTIARREAGDVTLVAVSKTHPAGAIEPLLVQGQRHFGENRVQEAQDKWPALREVYPAAQLHLIGQLQSNKADDAVALFDVIHSLDRPSLVKALAKAKVITPWPEALQSQLGLAINGLHMIDEKALSQLYDETFLSLRKAQALPIAYAVNLSLPQTHLLGRLARLNPGYVTAPENLDSFFDNDEDLSFDFDA